MHSHLYSYYVKNKILDSKKIDFQKGHSTGHTIAQLVRQIHKSFGSGSYAFVVFIDSLKTFGTISQAILLEKLKNYGFPDTHLGMVHKLLDK